MNTKYLTIVVAGVLVLFGGFLLIKSMLVPTAGNVITQGIIPNVFAQTDVTVGPLSTSSVAAAKTNCTSRIISTASTSVMLSFASGYTPVNGLRGVWQAASTTKEYDNATYGCGAIFGFASASSTINVVTTIQQ